MRKIQVVALTLLACVVFTSAASAQVALHYTPTDGNVSIFSADRSITTIEVISKGSKFIPANANDVFPFPSLVTEAKFFKLGAGAAAFNTVDFGNILPIGLTQADLDADFGTAEVPVDGGSIDGSLTPVDGVADNGLWAQNPAVSTHRMSIVPEPSSLALVGFGLLGLLGFRKRS